MCLRCLSVSAQLVVVVSPQTNVEETYFCLSVWANNRLRFKKSFNEAQETKRRKRRRTRVKMLPPTNFNSSEQQCLYYYSWNDWFSFRET